METLHMLHRLRIWKDKQFIFSVCTGLIIFFIGILASDIARIHLQNSLKGMWEPDLILDHIPVMDLEYFLVWGLEMLFAFLILIIYIYPKYLPFSLKSIGLLYFIRSFFIVLTPLGARPEQVASPHDGFLYELAYGTNEFFFSGHTSFPLLLALILWRKPLIRTILLIATILFGVAVLVAHTHYSIDVFAVPFMVPTIYALARVLFPKDFQYTLFHEHADFKQKRHEDIGKTLSVVIPAFNEERYLPKCLQSLTEYAPNAFLEIIVIDNGSSDHTADIAKKYPNVRVVMEPKKGLTYARQRGLLEAKGTYIAYLDADTQISPQWLETVEHAFESNRYLVALSGPYHYDDMPAWKNLLVRGYWWIAYCISCVTGYVLVGGNFVARKDALEKIGGFDTTISFYGEDTNIARRLYAVGNIRFQQRCYVHTSSRRLQQEGLLRTAVTYVLNYTSEVLLKKPITKKYTDIR